MQSKDIEKGLHAFANDYVCCGNAGDELALRHTCAGPKSKPWVGTGTVIKLDEASEEVVLELKGGSNPPTDTTVDYSVEFVWKSTTFDRMQRALKLFVVDETSVSGYLYHRYSASVSWGPDHDHILTFKFPI
jgi:hypothetical protein